MPHPNKGIFKVNPCGNQIEPLPNRDSDGEIAPVVRPGLVTPTPFRKTVTVDPEGAR